MPCSNQLSYRPKICGGSKQRELSSGGGARTHDKPINSRLLCQLSYPGLDQCDRSASTACIGPHFEKLTGELHLTGLNWPTVFYGVGLSESNSC